MEQIFTSESFATITHERKDTVALVTLNRPKVLNALNRKATIGWPERGYEGVTDERIT